MLGASESLSWADGFAADKVVQTVSATSVSAAEGSRLGWSSLIMRGLCSPPLTRVM